MLEKSTESLVSEEFSSIFNTINLSKKKEIIDIPAFNTLNSNIFTNENTTSNETNKDFDISKTTPGNEWNIFRTPQFYDKPFRLYKVGYKKDEEWTSTTLDKSWTMIQHPVRVFLGARSDELKLPSGQYGSFTFKIRNEKVLQEKAYFSIYEIKPTDFTVVKENEHSVEVKWNHPIKPKECTEVTLGQLIKSMGYKVQLIGKQVAKANDALIKKVFNIADQTLKALSKMPFAKGVHNLTKDHNKNWFDDDYDAFINGNQDSISMYRFDLHDMSDDPRGEADVLWKQIEQWVNAVNNKIKNTGCTFTIIDNDWDEGTVGLKKGTYVTESLNTAIVPGNEFLGTLFSIALFGPMILGALVLGGTIVAGAIDNKKVKKVIEKIKPHLEPYMKSISIAYTEYTKFYKTICPKMIQEFNKLNHIDKVEYTTNMMSQEDFAKIAIQKIAYAIQHKQITSNNPFMISDYELDFIDAYVDEKFAYAIDSDSSEEQMKFEDEFDELIQKSRFIIQKYDKMSKLIQLDCNWHEDSCHVTSKIDLGFTYKDLKKLVDIINNKAKEVKKAEESIDIFTSKNIVSANEGIGAIALIIGAVLAGGAYLQSVMNKVSKDRAQAELLQKVQDRFKRYSKHIDDVRKEYIQNVNNAFRIINPIAKKAFGKYMDRFDKYDQNTLTEIFDQDILHGIKEILSNGKYKHLYSDNDNFRIFNTPLSFGIKDYDYDNESDMVDVMFDNARDIPWNKLNSKHIKWTDTSEDYDWFGYECDVIFDIKVSDLVKDIQSTEKQLQQSNESFSFTLDIPNYITRSNIIKYAREGFLDSLSDKLVSSFAKKHEDKNPPDKETVSKMMIPVLKPFIKKALNGYKAYTQFIRTEVGKQLNVLKGQVSRIIPGALQQDTYINAVTTTLFKAITNDKASQQYFDTENRFQNKNFNNVLHVSTGNHLKSRDNPNVGSGGTTMVILKSDFNSKNYPDFGIKSTNDRYIMPVIQFKKVDNNPMLMINCNINTEITSNDAKNIVNTFKQIYNSAKKSRLKELQAEEMGTTENFDGLNHILFK